MAAPFLVPILSVDPVDWDVYADWLEDHPGTGKYSPEKARRIAFVLRHWQTLPGRNARLATQTTVIVDGRTVEMLPRAVWPDPGPRQLWLVKRRDRIRRYAAQWNWYWSLWPTAMVVTAGQDVPTWRDEDRATDPASSPLCRQNPWFAAKFFNAILQPHALRTLLNIKHYHEYRHRFDRVHEQTRLDILIKKGCRSVRRFPWRKDGTRLDLENVKIQGELITADATHVRPALDALGRPELFPPRKFTLVTGFAGPDRSMLERWCHETIFKARPMSRDWVPA